MTRFCHPAALVALVAGCSAGERAGSESSESQLASIPASEGHSPFGRLVRSGLDTSCTATHLGGGVVLTRSDCLDWNEWTCDRYLVRWPARQGLSSETAPSAAPPLESSCRVVLDRYEDAFGDYALLEIHPAPDAALETYEGVVVDGTPVSLISRGGRETGTTKVWLTSSAGVRGVVVPSGASFSNGRIEDGTVVVDARGRVIGLASPRVALSSSSGSYVSYVPIRETSAAWFIPPSPSTEP